MNMHNIKLSVVVTLSIVIVAFIIFVNKEMMKEIEEMQSESQHSPQGQYTKDRSYTTKTLDASTGSVPVQKDIPESKPQSRNSKMLKEKVKETRVYGMPLDSPILVQ